MVQKVGECVCVFGFNGASNNFSVISRRCLVATGSLISAGNGRSQMRPNIGLGDEVLP